MSLFFFVLDSGVFLTIPGSRRSSFRSLGHPNFQQFHLKTNIHWICFMDIPNNIYEHIYSQKLYIEFGIDLYSYIYSIPKEFPNYTRTMIYSIQSMVYIFFFRISLKNPRYINIFDFQSLYIYIYYVYIPRYLILFIYFLPRFDPRFSNMLLFCSQILILDLEYFVRKDAGRSIYIFYPRLFPYIYNIDR